MKLSVFLAATVASFFSMSTALPVDFSNVLSTRDSSNIPSDLLVSRDAFDPESEFYTRELSDWKSPDLFTRETGEFDHLVARGGPKDHASAPPPKKQIPKLNLQCRKRAEGDQCMSVFVVWYQSLGPMSPSHWALFLSEAADAAAVTAGAKGIIYEVVDDHTTPSQFKAHRVPTEKLAGGKLATVQPSAAARFAGAKLLSRDRISPNAMDGVFSDLSEAVLESIAEYNSVKDKQHTLRPKNCQDFVIELAGVFIQGLDPEKDFEGVPRSRGLLS